MEPPPIAQGDLDTARSILEGWHTAGQRRPTDSNLTGRIWGLAECGHAIGDRDAAAVLYDRLLPYDGQLVVASISFIPASAPSPSGCSPKPSASKVTRSCGAHALSARTPNRLAQLT